MQDFSTSPNGGFGSAAEGLASDQRATSPGKSLRGTDRAKLACVGCRRDNKKASLFVVEGNSTFLIIP